MRQGAEAVKNQPCTDSNRCCMNATSPHGRSIYRREEPSPSARASRALSPRMWKLLPRRMPLRTWLALESVTGHIPCIVAMYLPGVVGHCPSSPWADAMFHVLTEEAPGWYSSPPAVLAKWLP